MTVRFRMTRNDKALFPPRPVHTPGALHKAVISVGSNIEPEKNIPRALSEISGTHEVISQSRCRRTKPVGYADQPDFLNCALCLLTSLSYRELTRWLKMLEKKMGRMKMQNRDGPRTIDLDIVIWNGKATDSDVYEREYLKQSILEIWPDFY